MAEPLPAQVVVGGLVRVRVRVRARVRVRVRGRVQSSELIWGRGRLGL